MTEKNFTEVTIGGKIYTLGGYEDEEYLQRIAAYINGKTGDLRRVAGFLRQSAEYQDIMVQLNLADDYFKARQKAEMLETKVELLEKEVFDLKHQLVNRQMQHDHSQYDQSQK